MAQATSASGSAQNRVRLTRHRIVIWMRLALVRRCQNRVSAIGRPRVRLHCVTAWGLPLIDLLTPLNGRRHSGRLPPSGDHVENGQASMRLAQCDPPRAPRACPLRQWRIGQEPSPATSCRRPSPRHGLPAVTPSESDEDSDTPTHLHSLAPRDNQGPTQKPSTNDHHGK